MQHTRVIMQRAEPVIHEIVRERPLGEPSEHARHAVAARRISSFEWRYTVVYYFPSKAALITAVIQALGSDLEGLLEAAFGTEPLNAAGLVKRAWPVMTTPAADRVFALYFEIIGLAASGQKPFDGLAQALLEGWVAWLAPRTIGSDTATRRSRALSAIAQLDGLLLVRQLLGSDAGEQAAREAGVTTSEAS